MYLIILSWGKICLPVNQKKYNFRLIQNSMKCANSVLIRKFPNWIGLKLDLDMVIKPELENTQKFGCFDFYVDQNVFCILVFCGGSFPAL